MLIETGEFAGWVKRQLSDEELSDLRRESLNDPETGAVRQGCDAQLKIRLSDPERVR